MKSGRTLFLVLTCLALVAGCSKQSDDSAKPKPGDPSVVTEMDIQSDSDSTEK